MAMTCRSSRGSSISSSATEGRGSTDALNDDAIAINGVAGTGWNEIAVLGVNSSEQHQLEIRDLVTGCPVNTFFIP